MTEPTNPGEPTTAARTLSVQIGQNLYSITSDDDYLNYIGGGFEPTVVALFQVLVSNKEWRVLDVGANIGCTALLFADLASLVHAFEPSPSTFAFLTKNILASRHRHVHLHNIGLGEENFETSLTLSPSDRSGGFVSNKTQVAAGHLVENISIRKMDDICVQYGIDGVDFIKIDVEGFEADVLRGGMATLRRHKPVVTLELNHWCLNAFQRISVPDFFDFLRATFPILYAVHDSGHLRADLHNGDQAYKVMYEHIVHFKWPNIVGAFDDRRLGGFIEEYRPI